MIPKIIHYCWLSSDPFPGKIQRCIDSWQRYLPDYEIKLWNFERFPKGKSKWVDQAFQHKKYAFAADYIRCHALYHEGGIYLDSDVEIIKPFDDLLELPYFLGLDSAHNIEAAVMGFEKGNDFLRQALDYYDKRDFSVDGKLDMKPIPHVLKEIINSSCEIKITNVPDYNIYNNRNNIWVLPYNYFSPKSYKTGNIHVDEKTYTVHHFEASWYPRWKKLMKKVVIMVGGYRLKGLIKWVLRLENSLE